MDIGFDFMVKTLIDVNNRTIIIGLTVKKDDVTIIRLTIIIVMKANVYFKEVETDVLSSIGIFLLDVNELIMDFLKDCLEIITIIKDLNKGMVIMNTEEENDQTVKVRIHIKEQQKEIVIDVDLVINEVKNFDNDSFNKGKEHPLMDVFCKVTITITVLYKKELLVIVIKIKVLDLSVSVNIEVVYLDYDIQHNIFINILD